MVPAPNGDGPSRRGVLRATGAAVASGVAVLGAGCTSIPPLGSQIKYGTVDVPAAEAPAYRDWLPAPSTLPAGSDGVDGYTVSTAVPRPADAPAWVRSSTPIGMVATETDYVGFHLADADLVVASDAGVVLPGDVDREAVHDTLARTTYESAGSHAGYDLYARSDVDRMVAVGTDALVFGNGPAARETVRATVDASRGTVTRYHEADENVAALTDSAGMRRWAWLWPGGIGRSTAADIRDDTVGWASSYDLDDEGAYHVQTWLFPPDYGVTAGKVKAALKGNSLGSLPSVEDATAVDVTVQGRAATIVVFLSPGAVEREQPEKTGPIPYVTWRPVYDDGAEQLTIHHDAGDPVRTDWLSVVSDAFDLPAAEATDAGDRIEPGDALTVSTADLASGDTVRLVYADPDAGDWADLFEYDLP